MTTVKRESVVEEASSAIDEHGFTDMTDADPAAGKVGWGMTGLIAPPGMSTAEARERGRASEKPKS